MACYSCTIIFFITPSTTSSYQPYLPIPVNYIRRPPTLEKLILLFLKKMYTITLNHLWTKPIYPSGTINDKKILLIFIIFIIFYNRYSFILPYIFLSPLNPCNSYRQRCKKFLASLPLRHYHCYFRK